MSENKTPEEWGREILHQEQKIIDGYIEWSQSGLLRELIILKHYTRMQVLAEYNIIPTTNN